MTPTKRGRPSIDLDARTLRGLAHPLRIRILLLLQTEGPMTATGLADRLGELTGTTSWHLRQLAAHGFIQDVPEKGNKRERWWESVGGVSINSPEFLADPDLRAPALVLLHQVLGEDFQRAARFISEDWSKEWRAAWVMGTFMGLPMTPDDLQRFRNELSDLINKYRAECEPDRPGVEDVIVQVQAYPLRHSDAQ